MIFEGPGLIIVVEVMHQLSNSGAKAVFASRETLALVRGCALKVGIPARNIFLFEEHKVPGINTFRNLLDYGELQWERLHTYEEARDT